MLLQTGRSAIAQQEDPGRQSAFELQGEVPELPELQPEWALGIGALAPELLEANSTFEGLGFVQVTDELMSLTPTAKELEQFDLVKAERLRGFTCPNGKSYPPNYGEFKFDCRLFRAARKWSTRMATEDFIAHEKDGSTSCKRTEAEGFPAGKGCGENLAGTGRDNTPQGAIDQLKKSNGHCENMFEPKYNKLGVGFAYNANAQYQNYWTESFGEFPRGPDESCIGGSPAPTPAPGCADQDLNCEYYKNQGLCGTPNVERLCRDTCAIDNCGYGAPSPVPQPAPPSSGCADDPSQACAQYSSQGYCSYDHVKEACKKSCGVCSDPSGSPASSGCADDPSQACAHYSSQGYCSYDHVKEACKKSCGVCR